MLKYFTVQQVIDLGEVLDISMSRLFRLAFPAVVIPWHVASFFYEQLEDAAKLAPTASMTDLVAMVDPMTGWDNKTSMMESTLRGIAESGKATVLDSIGHGDDYYVVQGRAVWKVARIADGDMAYLGGHFFKEFEVTCVQGCAHVPRLSESDVDLDTM